MSLSQKPSRSNYSAYLSSHLVVIAFDYKLVSPNRTYSSNANSVVYYDVYCLSQRSPSIGDPCQHAIQDPFSRHSILYFQLILLNIYYYK